MPRSRLFARTLLAMLLVGACFAAAIAPMLAPAQAAPYSSPITSDFPGDLVISQFNFQSNQFVEFFNRSCTTAIDLTNYSVWASGTDTGNPTQILPSFPTGASIQPGKYYLLGGPGYGGSPAADATYSLAINSSDGGVAIVQGTDNTTPVDQAGFGVDGYFEGANPLTALTNGRSYTRNTTNNLYVDTNVNTADFSEGASDPHDAASAASVGCGNPTPVISGNVQAGGVIVSYSDGGGHTGNVLSLSDGSYSIDASPLTTGTITVTPQKSGFSFGPGSKTYNAPVTTSLINQNYSATLTSPTDRSVLINEVGWGGTRNDAIDQWIELYNPNGYGVDVSDMQLIASSGTLGMAASGNNPATSGYLNLKGVFTNDVMPGHGFLLIEKSSTIFRNWPPASYSCKGITYTVEQLIPTTLALSTYGQRLFLEGPNGQVDAADHLGYAWPAGLGGSLVTASNRASMERHNADADSPTAWITFAAAHAPCQDVFDDGASGGFFVKGSPGQPNWAQSGINATPSPTPTHYKTPTPYPPTPFGHMVINEFLPRAGFDWNNDGTVDVFDEFVELKNLGPIAAQIGGWKIDVISPGGPTSYVIPNQTLQPGQRVVFYRKTTNLALYDSGGTVRLINKRGVIIDARSYGPVASPDQSTCRIPDGFYWRFPCFPTPGNENSLTGQLPVPPPVVASQPAPCLLADTVPDPFKQAECYGFGAGIFNPAFWDNQSGFNNFAVPDVIDKGLSTVK